MNAASTPGATGIFGVVVLYHPDAGVEDNIRSYLPLLDRLTVVDNSPAPWEPARHFPEAVEKITYVWNNGANLGIAAALNRGAENALESGARWLLTMDQDSRFAPGGLTALVGYAEAGDARVGIVSPWHDVTGMPHRKMPERPVEVLYAFTSGNLVSLNAYRAAGPFLEKFFIDYVDFEYCLRLRRAGYSTLSVPAVLNHPLGEIRPRSFLGIVLYPGNRSPIRYYYMFRNRLYLWRHFPESIAHDAGAWLKTFLGVIFFEEKKTEKLRFMFRGLVDFFRDRYGPYRE